MRSILIYGRKDLRDPSTPAEQIIMTSFKDCSMRLHSRCDVALFVDGDTAFILKNREGEAGVTCKLGNKIPTDIQWVFKG